MARILIRKCVTSAIKKLSKLWKFILLYKTKAGFREPFQFEPIYQKSFYYPAYDRPKYKKHRILFTRRMDSSPIGPFPSLPYPNVPNASKEKIYSPSHACSAFQKMKDLYDESRLIDVTLVVADSRICAHRIVLSAASDYFCAMFTNDVKEAASHEVKMEGVDPVALQILVDYCYSGEIELNEEGVETLLSTANMLQLIEVVQACSSFIKCRLHPSNCIGIRMFSETQGCRDLNNSAENYIMDHFVDVVKNQEFLMISVEELHALLASEDINVPNEEVVFEAFIAWINHDLPKRREHASRLLSLIRLPLLPAMFIADKITTSSLFRDDSSCYDLLMETFNYHLIPERRALLMSHRTKPRKSTVGTLLVIGGMDSYRGSLNIDEYDPRTDSWSQFGTLTGRRVQFGASIINGKLYVVGGRDGLKTLNTVECYDLKTETWSTMPSMSTHRHGLGVTTLEGPMYAIGGHDGWSYLSTVERWDPSSGSWSYVAPMNTQRSTCGVAALNNRLYAVGGRDGSSCLNSMECYDPHTNKWSRCAPMSKRRGGAGVTVVNGYLFAFGGHDAPILNPAVSRFDCVERYDPQTDTWTSIAPMSIGRDGIGCSVLGDKIITVGGYDGQSCLTVVEAYDPQTNEWSQMSDLRIGRAGMCVVVVKNI